MLDDNNKRREWLEYDSDKTQMHCKDCRMYANGESQKRGPSSLEHTISCILAYNNALIKVEFLCRLMNFSLGW